MVRTMMALTSTVARQPCLERMSKIGTISAAAGSQGKVKTGEVAHQATGSSPTMDATERWAARANGTSATYGQNVMRVGIAKDKGAAITARSRAMDAIGRKAGATSMVRARRPPSAGAAPK